MNLWTFLDRNGWAIATLAIIGLIVFGDRCSISSGTKGCSVEIGSKPVAVDGGAP